MTNTFRIIPSGLIRLLEEQYASVEDYIWQEFVTNCRPAGFHEMNDLANYWRQPSNIDTGDFGYIVTTMKTAGWTVIAKSVRFIFADRGGFVIKLAVDGEGLLQNFLESYAYQDVVEKINRQIVGDTVIRIPALIDYHPRAYWVVQENIGGRRATDSDISQDVVDYLHNIGVSDIISKNFKVYQNSLWLVDLGHYRMQVTI